VDRASLKKEIRAELLVTAINRRCAGIFRAMVERAKKMSREAEIDFTADDLRRAANCAVGQLCPWCSKKITPKNFCFDHLVPISREGGTFALSNLGVPCSRCNTVKGALTAHEFHALRLALSDFASEARADIFSRLGLGGKWKR
jgi:5-methylcytosine-specific restriction endonuclease McrA